MAVPRRPGLKAGNAAVELSSLVSLGVMGFRSGI